MSDDDEKPEPQTEYWLYGGLRWGGRNGAELCDAWYDTEDGSGKALLFDAAENKRGAHGFSIGALYEVKVTRHADDGMTKHGRPTYYRGGVAPDDKRLEWSVIDEAIRTRRHSDKMEARARRGPDPIGEALAPLVEQARKLRTRADREALLARMIREVTSIW